MLKSTLPAFVLAASVMAIYAENEVTLKGGTPVSWSDFVSAVKDPTSVTGNIADLPANNTYARALATAKENKEAANTAYQNALATQTEKKTAKTTADEAVTNAQTGVTTAQTNLDKANEAVTAAQGKVTEANDSLKAAQTTYIADQVKSSQDKLDEANATLKKYIETDLPKLQSDSTKLAEDKKSLEQQLDSKNDNLTNATNSLAALPKKKGTVKWLADIDDAAQLFSNEFTDKVQDTDAKASVYYRYTEEYEEMDDEYQVVLYLAYYSKPNASGWSNALTQAQFRKLFATDGALKGKKITGIYVYLGPEYAATNSAKSENIIVTGYNGTNSQIPSLAANAIQQLANSSKYQGDTDEYENTTAASNYETQIQNLQKQINELSIQIYGAHPDSEGKLPYDATKETDGVVDQIKTTNTSISTLRGDITTLRDTTIPNYENAVTTAKTNAENAVKDDTATSKGITEAKAYIATANTELTTAKANVTSCEEALTTAQNTLATNKELAATAADELDAANTNVSNTFATLGNRTTAYETAEHNAQDAANSLAFEQYNQVTLNSDIAAAEPTGANYSGTIIGNGNTITIPSGALFNNFTGNLSKTAVNGTFATIYNNGTFTDVAVWTGTNGRYYGDDAKAIAYNEFDVLGFAARDNFGVDFASKQLVAKADNSIVYKLTVNQQDNNNTTQYVTIPSEGDMINATGKNYTLPVNTFAQSATTDIAGNQLANVYYGSDNNCDKVVVTDQQNFMCPVDVVTNNVEYTRKFKAGYNAACLPFALNYDYAADDNVLSICTFDQEDAERFWFTKNDGPIAAYTPVLIVGKDGAEAFSLNMTDLAEPVTIAKTNTENAYYVGTGSTEEGISYGTYKATNYEQFEGAKNGYKIYGLQAGQFVYAGASTQKFPAFRMVISSSFVKSASEANSMPRRIGIRNKNGVDITDETSGITAPKADATSFSVVGGQGEIVITSEADFGNVAIYTLDGKMISVANVMAGTTTVNLQQGVYIVLGKKVMVK